MPTIIHPASKVQEQFWLVNKIHPENSAYNVPFLFHIHGKFDTYAFDKALHNVIQKHDIMKSTYNDNDGIINQHIDNINIKLIEFNFSNDNIDKNLEEIHSIISNDAMKPFNLSIGPLIKLVLYRISHNDCFLLIVMHHIITDFHSNKILFDTISCLYNDVTIVPEKYGYTNKYSNYSKWQTEFMNSGSYFYSISYWNKKLSGLNHFLNLPTDKQRPSIQNLKGDVCSFSLTPVQTMHLKNAIHENNTTVFLFTFTTYLIQLFRYTGQKNIIVGVPFTNRRQAEHKNTIGCFVNILPLVFKISPEYSFADILGQVRRVFLDAHRNQEVPYEMIVKTAAPKRDPSYNPLFQTGFTFQPLIEMNLKGLEVTAEKIHNGGSQLDLFVILWEHNNALHGMFEYDTSLFEKTTIQRWVGHFKTLLDSLQKNVRMPIAQLPMLEEAEREQLIVKWNATELPFPHELCLQQLFEQQASKNPGAIACVFENDCLSYGALEEKSNKLAHYLRDADVGPGTLVGIFTERSLEMLIAVYGVLKAGGAYVPLDPDFPKERISFMIGDSNAKVLVTTSRLAYTLPAHSALEIHLDKEWSRIDEKKTLPPESGVTSNDLAYIIYTSGSTGKPKGVQVRHQAVVNFLVSMQHSPGITSHDKLLAVTTLSFDISVLELFLPLVAGAQIILADRASTTDGHNLLALIKKHHVTIMQATPTTWHLLLAAGWNGSGNFKALCGGEAMPKMLARELCQRATTVWNLYGPTETTIWSTCYQIKDENSPVFVGKPIANTQVYIVDANDQPTPIGIAGEMLIGGTGVAKGYLNRPDLTDEKFITDFFRPGQMNKLYRTGDMAAYLPDGNIKLLGRIDHQVKIRGHRIELGEIEASLAKCFGINEAVVMVREDMVGDKRLVAYYTLKAANNRLTTTEYRLALQKTLPDYMIPAIFVEMKAMPLTANGKIDRRALPVPDQKRPELAQNYIEAKGETQQILSKIWSDVLKVDPIGIHDNFFDLGGDSLRSIMVLSHLEKVMGLKIPAVKFFQYPTISSFSEYLSNDKNIETVSLSKNITQRKKALVNMKRSRQFSKG